MPRRRHRRGGRGQVPQAVAVAGAGRGQMPQPVAGAGRGQVPQPVAGAELVEIPQEDAARRDGRDLTQRQAMREWEGPNLNHLSLPGKGKPFERKGIFLQLGPEEFKEVILGKTFLTRTESVNTANGILVKILNEVQYYRLCSFWFRRNGASKLKVDQMKTGYESMLDKLKIYRQRVEELKGIPVPTPDHFFDRKVIFG